MKKLKEIWLSHLNDVNDDIIRKTKLDINNPVSFTLATDIKSEFHSLFIEFSSKIDNGSKPSKKFNGVDIFLIDNNISISLKHKELIDTFDLFIQNIVSEIDGLKTESQTFNEVINVIEKWRALFGKLVFEGLTIEQQKGLLGELIFLKFLLENNINQAVVLESWTGPNAEDKDFTMDNNCVEVKFTESNLPRVKISNERQLELFNLNSLHLINYKSEKVQTEGLNLKMIVNDLRSLFKPNKLNYKLFNELLEKVNYYDIHDENYQTNYIIRSMNIYKVGDDFPKITQSSLMQGVYQVSYHIEDSAISEFMIDDSDLLKILLNGESV